MGKPTRYPCPKCRTLLEEIGSPIYRHHFQNRCPNPLCGWAGLPFTRKQEARSARGLRSRRPSSGGPPAGRPRAVVTPATGGGRQAGTWDADAHWRDQDERGT